jgi:hypothetical protein
MLIPALKLATSAVSGASAAVSAANDATDSMIEKLKANENTTINRIGRVLEGTKFGFMLGYLTPSIVTAVGVTLTTGDLLAAVGGGIAVLGNPVAGVAAAVGAVYFGWKALSEKERDAVLKQVGDFLKTGYEQIKAVINYSINLMKELLSADNLNEMKEAVAEAAELIGKHLADITKSIKDQCYKAGKVFSEAADSVSKTASEAADSFTSMFKKKPTDESDPDGK